MKTLKELINTDDPAWPLIEELVREAPHRVSLLPGVLHAAEEALTFLQVTTHSFLVAVAYEAGGLVIKDGLIRVFGNGAAVSLGPV